MYNTYTGQFKKYFLNIPENRLFSSKNRSLLNFHGLLRFFIKKWTTDSFSGH
jgi:hypothetical protein